MNIYKLTVRDRFLSVYMWLHVMMWRQSEASEREVLDIQSEFEFERIDYLDTIRKQEQQNKWLQAVLDRIHPLIRKDCNFVNLEKVRSQSEWDENNQFWTLPKLTIEKTHLPPTGTIFLSDFLGCLGLNFQQSRCLESTLNEIM